MIDANVFVSAAIQRGASHRIVMSWLAGTAEFEIVMCPELLAEVREVLTARPRLRRWISLEDATRFVDAIVSGDRDLLEWEAQDPPVLPPGQFERRL